MKQARLRATFPLFFLILLIVVILRPVYADTLLIATSKHSYSLGATIKVFGSLMSQGDPVTDGLVAVQVDDDAGYLRLIRVLCTGQVPAPYEVRIVEFLSCDYEGNPKNSFERGEFAFFKVTVENLKSFDVDITVFFTLFDSVGRSFTLPFRIRSLTPGQQFRYTTSFHIPLDFLPGIVNCYVNVLTGNLQPATPKSDGYPCCPEESVEITVTGTATETTSAEDVLSTSPEGSFELHFKLPDTAKVGTYTAYTRARYNAWASVVFDYCWLYTDIDRNGHVNILDISTAAKAFGSKMGDSNYNRYADINEDNWINILDISAVAKDFGKIMT